MYWEKIKLRRNLWICFVLKQILKIEFTFRIVFVFIAAAQSRLEPPGVLLVAAPLHVHLLQRDIRARRGRAPPQSPSEVRGSRAVPGQLPFERPRQRLFPFERKPLLKVFDIGEGELLPPRKLPHFHPHVSSLRLVPAPVAFFQERKSPQRILWEAKPLFVVVVVALRRRLVRRRPEVLFGPSEAHRGRDLRVAVGFFGQIHRGDGRVERTKRVGRGTSGLLFGAHRADLLVEDGIGRKSLHASEDVCDGERRNRSSSLRLAVGGSGLVQFFHFLLPKTLKLFYWV